jgi:hypothetical protein
MLVDASTAKKFDFAKYKDAYTEKLFELINAKVGGKEIGAPPVHEQAQIINLMDALLQSVEHAHKTTAVAEKPPKKMAASVRKRERARGKSLEFGCRNHSGVDWSQAPAQFHELLSCGPATEDRAPGSSGHRFRLWRSVKRQGSHLFCSWKGKIRNYLLVVGSFGFLVAYAEAMIAEARLLSIFAVRRSPNLQGNSHGGVHPGSCK